jgi:hypothetical protein
MATLSRAVASPFSYVVAPVDVISIGAFSGVLISPRLKPALARREASNKTGVRMADAERTAVKRSCKAKSNAALIRGMAGAKNSAGRHEIDSRKPAIC